MPDTDRDLPGAFVVGAIVFVVAVAALVPGVFAGEHGARCSARSCAAGVGIFGVLFVTVAARIVGIVGVTSQPTSGIALITLLGVASVFAAMGWNDPGARAAVLTVATIVAIAGSKAGRHLAGPEDRVPGGRDAGAAAARAVDRRVVRVLGRGGDAASCSAPPTRSDRRTCPRRRRR